MSALLCWLLVCAPTPPARPPVDIAAIAYVIDPTTGTRAFYLRTGDSLRSVAQTLRAGDTLFLRGGTYTEWPAR